MAPEIQYILDHAECTVCIVENFAQLEKVLSIKRSLRRLNTLIVLDPDFHKVDADAVAKMASKGLLDFFGAIISGTPQAITTNNPISGT